MGRLREQPVVSFLGKTVVISVSPVINVLLTKVISKSDHLFIMHHCNIKVCQMHIAQVGNRSRLLYIVVVIKTSSNYKNARSFDLLK